MVLKKEEFFNRLHDYTATDSSDETISFVEDITDTYNDLEKKANGDGVDWEARAKEIDEAWKEKYRHRFFSGTDGGNIDERREKEEDEEVREDIRVEDLFEKEC